MKTKFLILIAAGLFFASATKAQYPGYSRPLAYDNYSIYRDKANIYRDERHGDYRDFRRDRRDLRNDYRDRFYDRREMFYGRHHNRCDDYRRF